jgi:hypothetical protein
MCACVCVFVCVQEVKGWMLVAVLVLVSEDVRQVSGVIQRLTSAHCQCQLPDVVEAMYCMATFLLALRHEDPSQAWTGSVLHIQARTYTHLSSSLFSACFSLQCF